MQREKKQRVTLVIEPSLWAQVQTMAITQSVSTSHLIRQWLREKVKRGGVARSAQS